LPQADLAQQAATMLSVGAKPASVLYVLHQQQSRCTVKDVYNMRQKLKCAGMCRLVKPKLHYFMKHAENHVCDKFLVYRLL